VDRPDTSELGAECPKSSVANTVLTTAVPGSGLTGGLTVDAIVGVLDTLSVTVRRGSYISDAADELDTFWLEPGSAPELALESGFVLDVVWSKLSVIETPPSLIGLLNETLAGGVGMLVRVGMIVVLSVVGMRVPLSISSCRRRKRASRPSSERLDAKAQNARAVGEQDLPPLAVPKPIAESTAKHRRTKSAVTILER